VGDVVELEAERLKAAGWWVVRRGYPPPHGGRKLGGYAPPRIFFSILDIKMASFGELS